MQPTVPAPEERQVVEGEYLAPDPHPASGRNWKAAGGSAVGVALIFAKFKGLLFALLNFKWIFLSGKFALTGLSFFASVWFYALAFGWKFAFFFVLLIGVHELGHALFVRFYGLSVPNIYFVPGLGAFTAFSGTTTAYQQSVIALGGPLFGALGGFVCLAAGVLWGDPFWYAVANVTFLLNAINMVPVGIFDGGRITAPISPYFWVAGLVAIVAAAFAFHWYSPIVLIVVLLSLPKAISAFRHDPNALPPPELAANERATIALAYFGLLGVLLAALVYTHVSVPGSPVS